MEAFGSGQPLVIDGELVGAIGVSSARPDWDVTLADVGAQVLADQLTSQHVVSADVVVVEVEVARQQHQWNATGLQEIIDLGSLSVTGGQQDQPINVALDEPVKQPPALGRKPFDRGCPGRRQRPIGTRHRRIRPGERFFPALIFCLEADPEIRNIYVYNHKYGAIESHSWFVTKLMTSQVMASKTGQCE